MNGGVTFRGHDDLHGFEPWFTDGTVAGTRMIADVNPGSASSYAYVNGSVVSSGVLFFSAEVSNQPAQPWRSDGTAAGTRAIADAPNARTFTDVNGTIYFVGDSNDAAFTCGTRTAPIAVRSGYDISTEPKLLH